MSVRWIITLKVMQGIPSIKAGLHTKRFQKDQHFRTTLFTCSRESMRLTLSLISPMGWSLQSIDIKATSVQGKQIDRTIFIQHQKKQTPRKSRGLRKCIYGLAEIAPKHFYLILPDELIELGATKAP